MQIWRIHELDECRQLADEWNRLAAGVPFCRTEWLLPWWRHFSPVLTYGNRPAELYVVALRDGEELIGLAPCYLETTRTGGRHLRFLGSGSVCTDYLTVLAAPGRENEVAENLAMWLLDATDRPVDRWDILALHGIAGHDGTIGLLAQRLGNYGCAVFPHVRENTWRIELPSTVDAYLESLSKSHRKQLRQLQRRWLAPNNVELQTVADPNDLEHGWQILVHLHQRRFNSLGKPGCFNSPIFRKFHRHASQELLRSGLLELHWLECAGRPIAAEYHLASDGVVYAYQGGIDPDRLAMQPGRLITLATIERAIEMNRRAFDFCRGDEPYKSHWRAQPHISREWRVVGNRSAARWRDHLWQARETARRWVRKGLGSSR